MISLITNETSFVVKSVHMRQCALRESGLKHVYSEHD